MALKIKISDLEEFENQKLSVLRKYQQKLKKNENPRTKRGDRYRRSD